MIAKNQNKFMCVIMDMFLYIHKYPIIFGVCMF